jgi:carbamoylphosphate synthase large subunit
MGDGSPGKVVSKGAVLALARRHIEALEKREMSLEVEKEILMEKTQRLERVLARLGG